jgi:hypothetical protein
MAFANVILVWFKTNKFLRRILEKVVSMVLLLGNTEEMCVVKLSLQVASSKILAMHTKHSAGK